MICGRCQQPVKAGEEYTAHVPDSASTAAPTVYLHKRDCKKTPHQSAPVSIRR